MHGRVVEVVDEGEVVAEATERALALAARSRSA
jgi:hypothetical protein